MFKRGRFAQYIVDKSAAFSRSCGMTYVRQPFVVDDTETVLRMPFGSQPLGWRHVLPLLPLDAICEQLQDAGLSNV